MDEDELVAVLEDAGLSPYQAEAYVTILELGSASATDIAEASDVPDPRIYDVLRDLEDQGFVETYKQNSLHARAHSPSTVLSDLRSRAEQFEQAAEAIEDRWSRPPMAQSKVSIVSRLDTVVERAAANIRSATNQIQLCATIDQFERLRPALRTALENGVVIKLSVQADSPEEVDVDRLAGACTEARVRTLPSPFVAVVDRESVCFVPHSDSVNRYGVLVDDRSHAFVFHWFFLTSLWDVWDVIYTERDDHLPTSYVDIRYCIRDVVSLLNDGATVHVHVEGRDTESDDPIRVNGTVADVGTTSHPAPEDYDLSESPSISEFAGVASLSVDTGDGVVTVGGRGATLEDVETKRITITDIEYR